MPLPNTRKVPATGDHAVVATAAVTFFVMVFLLPVPLLEAKKAHGKGDPASLCAQCDKSKCPVIGPVPVQYCPPHSIVRDACGCCERCTAVIVVPTTAPKAHSCTNITCPARQMCMVNIQGLPVCRCPTEQMCRDFWPRPVKVCASEGGLAYVTYPSECHMRVATCNYPSRRIKLLHRGACDDSVRLDDFQPPAASKLAKGRDVFGWIEQQHLVTGMPSTSSRTTATATTKVMSKTTTSLTTLSTTSATTMTRTSAPPTTSSTASSTSAKPTTVTTAAASTSRTTVLPTAVVATTVVKPIILPVSASAARADASSSSSISQLATSGRGRNRSSRVQNQERNREGKRRDRAAAAAAAAAAHLAGAGRNAMRHGGGGSGSGSGRANGDKARVGQAAPHSS